MFSIRGKRKLLVGALLSLIIVLLASVTSAEERAFVSAEEAAAKIHPNLMADVTAGLTAGSELSVLSRGSDPAAGQIQFVARIAAGADLSAYTDQWFARPYVDPAGNTVASGFASPNGILKIVTLSHPLTWSLMQLPLGQHLKAGMARAVRFMVQKQLGTKGSPVRAFAICLTTLVQTIAMLTC